jgi:hypothetical protein
MKSKTELKNSLVDLNLSGIITDKELITFNKRLNQNFLHSEQSDEIPTIKENEDKEKLCVACGGTFTHDIDYNGYCSQICRDGDYAK